MFRALLHLCLVLTLVVSGVAAAAAAKAADRLVICSGNTEVVIYLDANGAPTHAPHLCPDCTLTLVADLPVRGITVRPMHFVSVTLATSVTAQIAPDLVLRAHPRGPPLLSS